MAARYKHVNSLWPEKLPPLTADEAVAAARKLYRFALKRSFTGKIKIGTGNRRTWIKDNTLTVNPGRGWHSLVHSLSHYMAYRLHPGKRPHSPQHHWTEQMMVQEVIKRGWLDGRLKRPEKPKPNLVEIKLKRVENRILEWMKKQRRAETALKKLIKQKRYYEKRAAA